MKRSTVAAISIISVICIVSAFVPLLFVKPTKDVFNSASFDFSGREEVNERGEADTFAVCGLLPFII